MEKPDLVITQELCDVCSVSLREVLKTVSELANQCTVISLEPHGLDGVLDNIVTVGSACGVDGEGERSWSLPFERGSSHVRDAAKDLPRKRVFCAEWYDPLFAPGHWVPEMVEIAGGMEVAGSRRGVEEGIVGRGRRRRPGGPGADSLRVRGREGRRGRAPADKA